ncbi:MAG: hypothetical protein ACRCTA_06185, partial [Bacilli bacterium]
MKKAYMLKKYIFILSFIILLGFISLKSIMVNAASSTITLDPSKPTEYQVNANTVGKVESNIDATFVQANLKKPNFSKVDLSTFSSPIANWVNNVHQMADGTSIVLISENNWYTHSQGGSPYIIVNEKVLKVSADGTILSSKNLASNQLGYGIDTSKSSIDTGDYATVSFSQKTGPNEVSIIGTMQTPSDKTNGLRKVTIDNNLNITYQDIDSNGFPLRQSIATGNYIASENKLYITGWFSAGMENESSFDIYELDLSSGKFLSHRSLVAPSYTSLVPIKPDNWYLATILNSFNKNASNEIVGQIRAYNYANNGDLNEGIYVWDASGNIKYSYTPDFSSDLNYQPAISDANNYYFIENNKPLGKAFLRNMNPNTGIVTTIQEFPQQTYIQISPDSDTTYDTKYTFVGSTPSATGVFAGYGTGGGAISGTMKEDFSVYNANIIATNGWINFGTIQKIGTSDLYMSGGSLGATDFARPPVMGYQDQSEHSSLQLTNSFFGTLRKTDDYAPALKLTASATVNVDTTTNLDSDLMSGVIVDDTYDLDVLGGNHTNEWLLARVNKNPKNINAPIDWKALGLDVSKVGPYSTTYFVTDSSNQQTVSSRNVNITKKTTVSDPSDTLALDASNFVIPLKDASKLTEGISKDSTHANVSSWNLKNFTILTSNVTTNKDELDVIINTKVAGAFPLTYTIVSDGITLNKTITVFVSDDNTVVKDGIILFAQDFTMLLKDAASATPESISTLSNPIAYNVASGLKLDNKDISLNIDNVLAATKVGPYSVAITYNNTVSLTTNVIASLTDDNTTINKTTNEIIYATPFTIHVDEVASLTDEIVINKTGAFAWDMNSGDLRSLSVDHSKVVAQVGPYPVTFTTALNTTKTVTASVIKDTTIVDTDKDIALNAENFIISLKDVKALTEEISKDSKHAKVNAWQLLSGDSLNDIVLTNLIQLEAINNATQAGAYPLTYTVTKDKQSVEKEITVFVTDNNTIIKDGIILFANNFKIHLSEAKTLTFDRTKDLSAPVAYSIADGKQLDPKNTTIDFDLVLNAKEVGPYEVYITYTGKTTVNKTIIASVIDDNTLENSDLGANIYALPFTVHADEVSKLNQEKVIKNSKAFAWRIDNGALLKLTSEHSAIKAKVGAYPVTFTTTSTSTFSFGKNTDLISKTVFA